MVGGRDAVHITGAPTSPADFLVGGETVVKLVLGLLGGRKDRHADASSRLLEVALKDFDVLDLGRPVGNVLTSIIHGFEGEGPANLMPLGVESADFSDMVGAGVGRNCGSLYKEPPDVSSGVIEEISEYVLVTSLGVSWHLPDQGRNDAIGVVVIGDI